MLRILWNEEETAILVCYFMKFHNGLMTRKEAVKNASVDLRKRAVRIGLEIDDTFRNENGISMQMSKIEDLFYQRKGRLSKAPKVFENILELYHETPAEFNKILMEANGMFEQEIIVDNLENYEAVLNQYFLKGKNMLFYQVIFNDFNEKFLGQRIYNADILKSYLMHELPDSYYYEQNYMLKEQSFVVDLIGEVRNYLIEQAVPVKLTELYQALSHFPPEKIDVVIHSNQEFICNRWGEYFHVSLVDFSEEELQKISGLVCQRIEESHFISGHELIQDISQKYPKIMERFTQFSEIGIRDSIAYHLKNRFSFKRNIISLSNDALSMGDVFAEFAETHDSFTLEELNVLKFYRYGLYRN